MIKSMTAFGRGEAEGLGLKISVEVRTLNHRFLDFHLRLPRTYLPLEDRVRKLLSSRIARGRVEFTLIIEPLGESNKSVVLDRSLLQEVKQILEELRQFGDVQESLKLEHFLQFPDLITIREKSAADIAEVWNVLSQAVLQALEVVEAMRQVEGENLGVDLESRLELIDASLEEIRGRASLVPQIFRDKLADRLTQLLPETSLLDDSRLLQEVALMADRTDITEELTRLSSHLEQFRQTLGGNEPVGRKLDFLLQELHREINTIGSKAGDVQISQAVISIKGELERLREQVQNIE
jgi:uncharacterized protein (TIGR00255 family)